MPVTQAEFLKKTLLAAHARGLVFREVPMAIYKLCVNKTRQEIETLLANATPAQRNKFTYALSVKATFEHIIDSGMCAAPVEEAFTETAFRDGGFRTDAVAVLAFSMLKNGLDYALVGVAAWGAADVTGTGDENLVYPPSWRELVEDGEIAEVDILCSAPARAGQNDARGMGSLLLAYTLARAASRKKNGSMRFKGAVMNLAFFSSGGRRNAPLANIATRFGFQAMPNVNRGLKIVGVKGDNWFTGAYNALPSGDDDFKILCPLVPRSGKSYCA